MKLVKIIEKLKESNLLISCDNDFLDLNIENICYD